MDSNKIVRNNHNECADLNLPSARDNNDVAKKLINQAQDLDAAVLSERPALHITTELGEPEIIEILLGRSAHYYDMHYKKCSKTTQFILKAFYTACSKINDNIKRDFAKNNIPVDFNINIDQKFLEKFKPLHFAVKYQQIEIIKILIENGIDVEAKDASGMTALHCAVQDTQMGLLENDHRQVCLSSIYFEGQDEIDTFYTFSEGVIKIIDLLLGCGCDINAVDHFGRTPIFYLYNRLSERRDFNSEVIDCLSCYYLNPCSRDYGRSHLFSIADARRHIIHRLLSLSPALDLQDHEGNTILHLMAKTGNIFWELEVEVAEEYLRNGGDVDALNQAGYTALHYTCGNGCTQLMNIILQYGADVNLTRLENMERPIHRAILFLQGASSAFNTIEQLLVHGANVDVATTYNMTPILLATKIPSGSVLMIMCLLNWGCDLNCTDSLGRTPLHYMCFYKRTSMLELFLKHGADINAVDHQGETPFSIVRKVNRYSLDSLILFSYLKRLVILGVSLCETNRKLYELHSSMLNLVKFVKLKNKLGEILTDEQCRTQLEYMKTVHIDNYTTLYDVLQKNTDDLIHHVNNQKLSHILCDAYFDEDYSVYGYLVKIKIKNAKKRAALMKPAMESLMSILKFHMPEACFEGILSHLKNDDLKNVIEAKVLRRQMEDENEDESEDKSVQIVKRRRLY